MRVGIFYFSKTLDKSNPDAFPVYVFRDAISLHGRIESAGFIRVEIVEAESEEAALSMAKPRVGESVMNTHEIA